MQGGAWQMDLGGDVCFDYAQSHAAGCGWVEAPDEGNEGNESAAP